MTLERGRGDSGTVLHSQTTHTPQHMSHSAFQTSPSNHLNSTKKRKIPETPIISPQQQKRRLDSPLTQDDDLFDAGDHRGADNTRRMPQASVMMDELISSDGGSDSDDSMECRLNKQKQQQHNGRANATASTKNSKPTPHQITIELKKEQQYIEEIESKNRSQNRELCDLFYDLQAISNQHKIRISYPELVIIGGQSDGKSSLSEALCGFQFNLVDSNIGTRRPVIIQMRNDPAQLTPKCTFLKEDGYKSEQEVPVEQIAEEIRKRTHDYCGDSAIRSRPIVIRISFKNASNLTVYDLPGFRTNPEDPHGEYIKQLAYKICKPKNRILICLEQSTVEYANSQSRPLVQEFDAQLTRTIFVHTKFDNRRKQFTTKAEAEKYLRAEDASDTFHQKQVPIFFISLPAGVDGRNLSVEEFNRALKEVHLKDVKNLLKLNVDPTHKDKIGFFRLRNFLENRLTQEYRKSVEPVSRKIASLIDKKQKQANHLSETIQNLDKQDFRDILDDIISDFHRKINTAISGTTMFDPQLCGMTLEEEKQKSGSTDWPNFVLTNYPIRNSSYKLYGGSQVERLLSEFAVIAHSQEFPGTSSDEVVASLGLSCSSPTNVYRAISDLAQKKCVKTFAPLIHVLFHRSRFILKHLIRVVVHYLEDERQHRTDRLMLAHVRKSADTFIDEIVRQVEEDTLKDFETTTQNVDWNMIMSAKPSEQDMEYDLLSPSPEDTLRRVQGIVTREQDPSLKIELFSGDLTDERCRELKLVAARLFAGLRFNFVKNTQSRYRNFFLQPLLRRMDSHLRKEFKMSNEELKEMIGIRIVEFKEKHEELQGQLRGLHQQRDKFVRACDSLCNLGQGAMDATDCNSEDSQ